jgi:hypothetical protein
VGAAYVTTPAASHPPLLIQGGELYIKTCSALGV